MQITFDTSTLTDVEARGLVALLAQTHQTLLDEHAPAPTPAPDGTPMPEQNMVPPPPVTEASAPDDLDAEGLPWDERIHSASKAKTADGKWRRRRNLDDATYEAVVGELRGSDGAPIAADPSPVSAPLPPVQAAEPPPSAPPPPPPVPVAPADPAAPPTSGPEHDPQAFATLMMRVKSAQVGGKITPEEAQNLFTQAGATAPAQLIGSSALRAAYEALLDALLASR